MLLLPLPPTLLQVPNIRASQLGLEVEACLSASLTYSPLLGWQSAGAHFEPQSLPDRFRVGYSSSMVVYWSQCYDLGSSMLVWRCCAPAHKRVNSWQLMRYLLPLLLLLLGLSFEVLSLERQVQGSNLPLPKTLIKSLLNVVMPSVSDPLHLR
jgi:hypothetical protein